MLNQSQRMLKNELLSLNHDLDLQVDEIAKLARQFGCGIHEVKTSRGDHMITEIMVAKAQVLNGLAILEAIP